MKSKIHGRETKTERVSIPELPKLPQTKKEPVAAARHTENFEYRQTDGRYNRPRPGYSPSQQYTPAKTKPYRAPSSRQERMPTPSPIVPLSPTYESKKPWSGIDSPYERHQDRIQAPQFRIEGQDRVKRRDLKFQPLPEKTEDPKLKKDAY